MMVDPPTDVLDLVFPHLYKRDRLSAALVSKRWNKISRKFVRDICIFYGRNNLKEGMKWLGSMTRPFGVFEFNSCIVDRNTFMFLEKFKSQVTTLSFLKCEFRHRMNLDVFTELRSLSINTECTDFKFDSDAKFTLEKVRVFQVRDSAMSDTQIVTLCNKFPNLEELYIHTFCIYLAGCCYELSEATVAAIFRLKNLKKLVLDDVTQIYDFTRIVRSIHPEMQLAQLSLDRSVLGDEGIVALCDRFPYLEWLHLRDCKDLTDVSANRIARMEHLTDLELRGCTGMSKEALDRACEAVRC